MLGFVVVDDGVIADVGDRFVAFVDGGVLGVDVGQVGAVVLVDVAVPGVVVNGDVGFLGIQRRSRLTFKIWHTGKLVCYRFGVVTTNII